ncbi:TIP41-like protein [Chlorella vulgaris]
MLFAGGTVDENAVKAASGEVLEGGNGVRVAGWAISSGKGPITPDADLEHIKQDLHTLAAPEQFYGRNFLRLTHEASGLVISFTALDALKGWLADQSPAVHVGESEEWLRARQADVEAHAAERLEYDWTYTTSYTGTVTCGGSSSGNASADASSAAASDPSPRTQEAAAGAVAAGTAGVAADGPASSAAGGSVRWEATSCQINRALLTSRDPILYYDELALYESELDDHGSSRVSLKVRVMPRCWYVLLRFWLRVDHVMVRLRETRLFCQFDSELTSAPTVLREVRHHEGTFADLRKAGAPAEGPAYADPDTAAAALMAVAPIGVTQYRIEQLCL